MKNEVTVALPPTVGHVSCHILSFDYGSMDTQEKYNFLTVHESWGGLTLAIKEFQARTHTHTCTHTHTHTHTHTRTPCPRTLFPQYIMEEETTPHLGRLNQDYTTPWYTTPRLHHTIVDYTKTTLHFGRLHKDNITS